MQQVVTSCGCLIMSSVEIPGRALVPLKIRWSVSRNESENIASWRCPPEPPRVFRIMTPNHLGYRDWGDQRLWACPVGPQSLLGAGSFAQVHLGTCMATGEQVAIKVRQEHDARLGSDCIRAHACPLTMYMQVSVRQCCTNCPCTGRRERPSPGLHLSCLRT